jgi:hypothetical protein
MTRISDYCPPIVGTVLPLRSKHAEDIRLDFVKAVADVLEKWNLINWYMKPIGRSEPMKVRVGDYINKLPLRRTEDHWIDGGRQVAVFQPEFLLFFMNRTGSKI